jgi:hypothetical protein
VGDNLGAGSADRTEEVTSPYFRGAYGPPVPAFSSQGSSSFPTAQTEGARLSDPGVVDAFGGTSVPDAFAGSGVPNAFAADSTRLAASDINTFPGYSNTFPGYAYGTEEALEEFAGVGQYGTEPPGGLMDANEQGSFTDQGGYGAFGGPEEGQAENLDPFAAGEGPSLTGASAQGIDSNPFALPDTFGGNSSASYADPFAAGDDPEERARPSFGGSKDSGAFGSTFFSGAASGADESGMASAAGRIAEEGPHESVSGEHQGGALGDGGGGREELVTGEPGAGADYATYEAAQGWGGGSELPADFEGGCSANLGYSAEYPVETYQPSYADGGVRVEAAVEGGEVLYGGHTWETVGLSHRFLSSYLSSILIHKMDGADLVLFHSL